MSRKGWLLFGSLCVIWGIPYLLIRVAVRELPPPSLVFLRTAPTALLLVPLAARRGQLRPLLPRWRWILAFAAAELAVPWLMLSHAEERMSSSMAGLMIAAVPLIGAVLYPMVSHSERLGTRRLAGLVIGFAGVAALVGIDASDTSALSIVEVGITALGYALGPLIISRRLADLPSLGVIAVSITLTAVLYAPFGIATMPASLSGEVIASVATLALVCTAAAFLIFFALILEVGPSRSTVITYINPLVAVLLGVLLLGEPFTVGIAVGLPLIVVGSLLATSRAVPRPEAEAGESVSLPS